MKSFSMRGNRNVTSAGWINCIQSLIFPSYVRGTLFRVKQH
jgi:hypothetical protein